MKDKILNVLTPEQLEEFKKYQSTGGKLILRFMCDGKSIDISYGNLVGGNVIYQVVYWDWTKEAVDYILKCFRENNPGEKITVIYSE